MGDLDKSINRKGEPSPYEKISVNPIEGDKKGKEPFTGLNNATRSQVFAALVSYIKKILASLSFKGKGASALIDEQHLLDNVRAFKKLLQILAAEDESHNPDFTQQLSELWHILLDDCNSLSTYQGVSSDTLNKVNFFITQVQNFPPGADHTLGYYFTSYAGKEWIPFPFMELLQHLHEESKTNTKHSVLSAWVALLTEITS